MGLDGRSWWGGRGKRKDVGARLTFHTQEGGPSRLLGCLLLLLLLLGRWCLCSLRPLHVSLPIPGPLPLAFPLTLLVARLVVLLGLVVVCVDRLIF